jgi:hypothetical protein
VTSVSRRLTIATSRRTFDQAAGHGRAGFVDNVAASSRSMDAKRL